eukprot:413793-Amorphochlora_amoeboformis.AAC.3
MTRLPQTRGRVHIWCRNLRGCIRRLEGEVWRRQRPSTFRRAKARGVLHTNLLTNQSVYKPTIQRPQTGKQMLNCRSYTSCPHTSAWNQYGRLIETAERCLEIFLRGSACDSVTGGPEAGSG